MLKPKTTPGRIAWPAGNRRQAFAQVGIYLAVVLGWTWELIDRKLLGNTAPMSNEVAIAIAGLLQYAFYATTREDEVVPARAAAGPDGPTDPDKDKAARFAGIQAGVVDPKKDPVDGMAGGRLG